MSSLNPHLVNWFLNKIKSRSNTRLELLDKVTIVIPSYERQDFLLRQLVYWNGSGVQLVILDGSPESLPDTILDIVSTWQDVTYLHLPVSMEARLDQAQNHIGTPYVASLCDDELFLKGALQRLVKKLDVTPELAGCIGQSVSFNYIDNKNRYDAAYQHWQYSAHHDDVEERIAYAFNPFNCATPYGLLRHGVWVRSWGKIRSFSCPYVSEIYQAIVTYASGKYIATDELYWLRSEENEPISVGKWDRKLYFHEWWREAKYQQEKQDFIENIVEVVKTILAIDGQKSEKIVMDAVNVYLDFIDSSFERSLLTRFVTLSGRFIKPILPERVFQQIKTMIGLNKRQGGAAVNSEAMFEWNKFVRSNNVEENNQEMVAIESLIKEFQDARNTT